MTFKNRARRATTLFLGAAAVAVYWLASPFLPTNQQTEWIRVFQIVFSAFVIINFIPGLYNIVMRPSPVLAQRYVLGTFFTWSGIFGAAVWLLLWRLAGTPPWMIRSDINGFWIWLVFVGAAFHLAAIRRHEPAPEGFDPDAVPPSESAPPRTSWGRVVVAATLSVLLGFAVFGTQPDARGITEWLRPYLADGPDRTDPERAQKIRPSRSSADPEDFMATSEGAH